jgi:hypothetical protein
LVSGAVFGQSTWPNLPDSYATLLQDANFLGSNLSGSINSTTTTIRVTSASLLTINQQIFVDYESMRITAMSGTTLTVVRGFDQTIPASHSQNARVYRLPGAALHNYALSAIFKLETTPFQVVSDAPSGACSVNNQVQWVPGGSIYGCVNGVWKPISGGGGGGSSSTTISFTSQTSVAVPYNLGSNNVLPTVYDQTGTIIPGGYTFTLARDGSNATLQFATPQSGSVTVASAGNQVYTQTFVNQTALAVPHGLGTLHPAMSVYNPTGTYLFGQTLSVVDGNNSTLGFAAPQSGTLILVRQ